MLVCVCAYVRIVCVCVRLLFGRGGVVFSAARNKFGACLAAVCFGSVGSGTCV